MFKYQIMRWNPFAPIIQKIRRNQFLKSYIKSSWNSTQSFHYVGGPVGFAGAIAGQEAGKNGAARIAAIRAMSDNPLRTGVKIIVAVIGCLYLAIQISGLVFKITFLSLIWGGNILLGIGMFLGWRDYKKHKKVQKLSQQESSQVVDEMIPHFSAHHPETRLLAMSVIHEICENSPGRLLKNTKRDSSSLATLFVSKLSEKEKDVLVVCSSIIKWLARDHGEMFLSHSKKIAHHIDSPYADVQKNLVIALGNIAQFDQEHHPSYAKAIAPAAKDLDSEVRTAAATALGNVRCPESVTILEYLHNNDTAPEVSQEAKNSLNKINVQTTT